MSVTVMLTWLICLNRLMATSSVAPLYAPPPSTALDHAADRLRVHADLHARALFLQEHRYPRVPLAPAAIQRLCHLLERDVGQAHGHLVLAPEGGGKRHILVRQPQGEGGGLELARQELIHQPVER